MTMMECDWCQRKFDSLKEFLRHCHGHLTREDGH